MIDALDRLIQKFRIGLHEHNRSLARERRHVKELEAKFRVKIAEVEDRIAFHMPIREQQPTESNRDYTLYRQGVKQARFMVLLQVVAAMQPGEEAPVNELGERLDF